VAFTPPPWLAPTWMLFVWVTAYLARMQFLRFTHSLAEYIAPPLVTEAKAVQRLYLYVPGGFLLAFGVTAGGAVAKSYTGDDFYTAAGVALAWLVGTVATLFGLFMLWRWSELIVGLRKAVAHFTREQAVAADADDPDAEYRHRHFDAEPHPADV
jgi:hypothetical protein